MLSVEQVTFRYDRRSQPVLRNASLSLDAGQVGVRQDHPDADAAGAVYTGIGAHRL